MAGAKNTRLSKVVKEFNIGMGTLIDFLSSKSVNIDSGPNTKIDNDTYAMVAKEFGKELIIKEQSKKVPITVKEITNTDTPTKSEEEYHPEEEVFIKTNVIKPEKPAEPSNLEPKKEIILENNTPKINIVGKINLDKNSRPVKTERKENPINKNTSVETKTVNKVTPKEKEKVQAKIDVPKSKVEKKEMDNKKDTSIPKNKVEIPSKNNSKEHFKYNSKENVKGHTKEHAKEHVKEHVKDYVKENFKESLKIQPKNPSPKKKDKDAILPRQTPEHITTRSIKLEGPKQVGTIDLSQFEKKKSPKNKKGKRERIHPNNRQKVDVNKESSRKTTGNRTNNNTNRNNTNSTNRNNTTSTNRSHTTGSNSNTSRNRTDNRSRNNPRNNNRKGPFRPLHKVVDEDQVQKQIKETYARMTEGKNKTRGSKHRRDKRDFVSKKILKEHKIEESQIHTLKVTEFVTVNELAIMMDNTPVTKIIEACMNLGLMVSINQRLDAEALVLVAEEFGYKIEFVTADVNNAIKEDIDKAEDLVERPPIITVMGHVDHGKTSLLDHIRKTNVIAGEAGGITQHIGAYNVKLNSGRRITFLDTPGHEAFTAMRARGAKITDLAIIIIAADDAIMPQTTEAINHAQAAGVPMIFAINKIDKPGANADKIKEQLSNMDILVEDWGGKYQCQEISAKTGLNVDKLLDKVLVEADLMELKANPNKNAKGNVIESSLDKGRGYLATLLVASGTLHLGDYMISGSYCGKIKAMFNERGSKISEASPSTPVSVLGLNGAPTAGETFNIMDDEKEAKDLAAKREQLMRIQGLRTQKHITLEEIGRRIAIGNFQELNVIVKGDVDGSIEALSDSIIKLSTEEIHVNVIHKAVGAVSESDVLLAVASDALIIGFQVRPSTSARKLAEKEEIEIRLYSVIYDAINEIKSGIEGMLAPEEKEEITATAEVRETFKITKVGTIAGCMVTDGKLLRTAKIRVIRDGIVIYTGELGSLKRFKDDVKEIISGVDCGLNIKNFNDIKVGDVVESFEIVKIKRTLA
ncbi:MAG: translation initiation factor IF-2 [Bacteroidales bacterium]